MVILENWGDNLAILKMKRMTLIGFNSDRKKIIETIHKYQMVHINKVNTSEMGLESKETASGISRFDSYMNSAQAALDILNKYVPEKTGMFSSREVVDISKYSMSTTDADMALKQCYEIIRMSKKIVENRENISAIRAKQAALGPYLSLDVPMQFKGTKHTLCKSGMLSGLWDIEKIAQSLVNVKSADFEILSADKLQTCIWIICHKNDADKLSEWEREVQFTTPPFSLSHRVVRDKIDVLEQAAVQLEQEILDCERQIIDKSEMRGSIEMLYDHMALRKEKYLAISKLGLTKNTFFMDSYIPEKYAQKLIDKLQGKFNVYIELKDEENLEEIPKKFENNAFAAPVEGITETYSMPSTADIDPNPIMAFFYYLFFGMMFSDAGYGLLVMLVCGILGFGKKLDPEKRRPYKMFFYCGISTAFWGIMYGSFFGNAIDTVANTFLGMPNFKLKPLWIDPQQEALKLLIFSVALGVIQILVGLFIKMYMLLRQKKYAEGIFDVGLWIFVILGIAVLAGGMGLGINAMYNVGIVMVCIGAAGLILTQGRSKKGIIGKLFGGILSLYDITSYVSDALSYSRLMALGLTTAVIGNVVNMLGSMGSGPVGVITFIIVFIAGHLLNFAINMLGAYVHTNRLQYVEFYGKFYEGGGKKFVPLAMETKYHRFVENEKQ